MATGNVYLFDRFHSLTGTIPADALITHSQKIELNNLYTAEFSCAFTAEREEAPYFGHRDVDDDSVFHLYKVTSTTSQDGLLSVEGVHVFFDEMSAGGYMNETHPDASALTSINALLLETTWELGTMDVDTAKRADIEWEFISQLESFWNFIEAYDVEFRLRMEFLNGEIVHAYVDLSDMFSVDVGKWFEYNDKLLTITKVAEQQEIVTALVGLGANYTDANGVDWGPLRFEDQVWTIGGGDPVNKPLNQEWVEIPAATALYGFWNGWQRFGIVRFTECEDEAELLRLTYDELARRCYPKENFKASIYPTPWQPPELGETVTIVRDDLGIRYQTRIFKITRDFLSARAREFEFGEAIVESPWAVEWDLEKKLDKHRRHHQKLKQKCDWTFADHEARIAALEP